jgi:hypothetical protein
LPIGRAIVRGVDVVVNEIHAQGDLMRATNQIDVFGYLVIRRIEIARIGRARANRKAVARDREARESFDRAVDLNAQIGGRKVRIN